MKNVYLKLFLLLTALLGGLPIWAQTYPLSDTDLATRIAAKQQITDVPTMYVTLPAQYANQDKSDNTSSASGYFTKSDGYQTCTVQLVDNSGTLENFTDNNVQIKIRGNSTAQYAKKPYRLKFAKDVKDAAGNVTASYKRDLLGKGYKKRNWVLMANYTDGSLIRNAVMYHIGKYVGLGFVPGYKYIDLVVNDNYRGTYQITDQVETGTNRVDIDEDNDWMLELVNGAQVDKGDGEQGIAAGNYNNVNLQVNVNVKNPEVTDFASSQLRTDVISYLNKWYSAFGYSGNSNDWLQYNDLDNMARFYVAINLTGDYDGFMVVKAWRELNSDKLMYGPLWDKDLAFGNFTNATITDLVEDYNNESQLSPKFVGLHSNVTFLKKVKEVLAELEANSFYTKLAADIDNLAKQLDNTQKQNFNKWEYTGYKGLGSLSYSTYAEYISQLKTWINTRIANVTSKIDGFYNTLLANKKSYTLDPTVAQWNNPVSVHTLTSISDLTISPANTVTSTNWSSLVLPFKASQSEMEAALGGTYELLSFKGVENGVFQFTAASSLDIEACTPYLIKMKSGTANTSWKFSDIISSTSNDNTETYYTSSDSKYLIKGGYHLLSANYDNTDYYLSGDQMTAFGNPYASPAGVNTMNGLQFYFESTDKTTPTWEIVSDGGTVEPSDPNEHKRQTTLPTIYIDGTLTTDGEWTEVTTEVFDDDASSLGGSNTYAGMEAKYKGTYKAGEKHGYRLKFKKKAKLNGFRQWDLLPLDNDATLLREALALELGKQLGMHFTPSYQFVDVCLSTGTADAYTHAGTYLLVDRVKVEDKRAYVSSENDWLLELVDAVDAEDQAASVAADGNYPNIVVKNPDPDDYAGSESTLTTPVKTYADATFMSLTTLSEAVNQEQFIKWYIAQEVMAMYKGLSDVYAYRSTTGTDQSLYMGPLWDNGRAFGNYKKDKKKQQLDMTDKSTSGSYDGLMTEYADYAVMRHLLKQLWLKDWFANGVQTKWNNVSSSLKSALTNAVTTLSNKIAASREKNYSTAGWQLAPLTTNYKQSVDSLTTYLNDRFDYLTAKFQELSTSKTMTYNTSKAEAMDTWMLCNDESVSVQLKKRGTIHGNEWNMVCLPFALTAEQAKQYFGQTVDIEAFSSASTSGSTVTLHFTTATSMQSGVPYLVKPTTDTTADPTFSGVTFQTAEPTSVEKNSVKFVGTLEATTLPSDGTALVLVDGSLYHYTGTTALNGCRAYFLVPSEMKAKSFTFVDETTGIELLTTTDTADGKVYNLCGQQLSLSADVLPSGIYIVNGKKIIVK